MHVRTGYGRCVPMHAFGSTSGGSTSGLNCIAFPQSRRDRLKTYPLRLETPAPSLYHGTLRCLSTRMDVYEATL